mmetsp:Transcript_9910/g.15260  ORF Transcript_9910/g.15260 Transcript_9910/m.15260 type:complete len:383 (-) Transcript_9910:90-1238(-)
MSHQDGLGKSARNRIQNITGAQVQALIAKLDIILPLLPAQPPPLVELLSQKDFLPGEAAPPLGGKHVLQEASILGNLRRIHALDQHTLVAVELGAGTARLSDRLQRVTHGKLDHILVDRQEFGTKSRDRVMHARAVGGLGDETSEQEKVRRVVTDIASFDLAPYCTTTNNTDATAAAAYSAKTNCVCMSKHLCGPAFDLALSCIRRVSPMNVRPPCALATCCHYLCTWDSFAGRDWWVSCGLSQNDFEVAVTTSQWASLTNNIKRDPLSSSSMTSDEKKPVNTNHNNSTFYELPDLSKVAKTVSKAMGEARQDNVSPSSTLSSDDFERCFSKSEKSKLGIQLKQLLDLARSACLQELGYNVELIRYTTRSIDNRLLIASIPS